MTAELWILVIVVIASLIILKKSFDWGMLLWALMFIIGLFGFLFFGVLGLIGGLIAGLALNFFLSSTAWLAMKLFDIGLVTKENRKLIAKGFLEKYRDEIMLEKKRHEEGFGLAEKAGIFSRWSKDSENERRGKQKEFLDETYSDEKLIGAFSKYINEIFMEVSKLKNPVRRHEFDSDTQNFRENFREGGQKWVEKPFFKSRPPFPGDSPGWKKIKEEFVIFCEDVIYDNKNKFMGFQKFKILIKGFFRTSIPIRGLFRKLLGLCYNVEHTRESIRYSYKKHVLAAQQEKIPLNGGTTPHVAGLYGALAVRYVAAGIPRSEFLLWPELSPFLLMKESDAVEALAEYVVCQENPKEGKTVWLSKLVNDVLRTVKDANPNYNAMATQALLHRDIYWRNFLEKDVNELLENEFLKILPPDGEIAPEVYVLMDEGLRAKIDNLKS